MYTAIPFQFLKRLFIQQASGDLESALHKEYNGQYDGYGLYLPGIYNLVGEDR
jgi:hypothetical protein